MAWEINYRDELARRAFNATKALQSEKTRFGLKRYYATRPVEWIEDWVFTYDPRRPGIKTIPFILFPRQRQFVEFIFECLRDRESGLAEKCRDGGLTWLCAAIGVHLWIYENGASIGFGSRKEQLVDRLGDPDSIFEKIRIIIRNLPFWMLPAGFTPGLHLNYMKIINPESGSNLKGEAGDNIGRGGRSLIYFKDESAHYERPELIEASLGDNTDVQMDISSVNGSANVFYRRRVAGEVWEQGKALPKGKVRVFVYDWRDDPRKTQEWYERRRAKAESEGLLHIFAQEVERDYSSSLEGIIIRPEWVRAAMDAHIKLASWGNWFSGEHVAANDIADGGGDQNAYASRHGVVLKHIEGWGGEAGEAARRAIPYCIEEDIHEIYYDSIGVGAGFKAEVNNMAREPAWPKRLRVMPWNGAASPLDPEERVIPGDEQSPTNEDQYANIKAQAWFRARSRFYKTYKAVTQGDRYDVAELISLPSIVPNIHQLTMELSQAVKKTSANGKTLVDKKPEGARSPNLADALVMCYCPTREISIFDVL
jgi:phage terminase large subunit